MKSKTARQIAAAFKASQSCNARKQKATGMTAARPVQEQAQNSALKFARLNASVEGLQDLIVLQATNAG